MGQVYRAVDTDLRRDVALKVLPPHTDGNAERVARFRREARALAVLNHPSICTIYEIGEQDGRIFIAMEFMEGVTLQQRIAHPLLDLDAALTLAIEMADALDAAHTARESCIVTSSQRISSSRPGPMRKSWTLD